jgi:hypothetical protein
MLLIPLLPVQGDAHNVMTGHPAFAALLAAGATGLTLLFRLPDLLVNSPLGRIAQRLGDVSYSLYLVHWPILVLLHYVPFGGTRANVSNILDFAVAVAAIVAATAALYRLFERPGAAVFTWLRGAIAALVLLLLAATLPMLQLTRFDQTDRQIFAAWTNRATYRCGKIFRIEHPGETMCGIGTGKKGAVLFVGDSHADAVKETFAQVATRAGYSTYFAVDNGPLVTPELDGRWLLIEARKRGARVVFLHYAMKNLTPSLIDSARLALANSGIRLVLIMPAPEYGFHVPQRLYETHHSHGIFPTQTLAVYRRETATIAAYVRRIPQVEVVDIAPTFCTPICRVINTAGYPLYFDSDHLTLTGAALLTPTLARISWDHASTK